MSSCNSENSSREITFMEYATAKKSTFLLFVTRLFTIFFTICTILPIFSGTTHPAVWFYRALMANAVTSVVRLYEIIKQENFQPTLSRETLSYILSKDAAHYLIFSILFISASPVTLALVPLTLFAVMHTSTFINKGFTETKNPIGIIKTAIDKVLTNQTFLLQIIALNEIMIMPITVITAISGGGNIFLPFVYYRFLCLRYSSVKNPYSKQVFQQLSMTVDQLAANAKCPSFVSSILFKLRSFVCRLSPQ